MSAAAAGRVRRGCSVRLGDAGPGEYPIAACKVELACSQLSTRNRRPIIHTASVDRSADVVWAKPTDNVPTTVKAFWSPHPWCVRLEQGAGVLLKGLSW